jgi:hypothetical protein
MVLRISGLMLTSISLPLIVVGSASAQIVASELATVTQTIAGTELEVVYSRPSLRGRALIFGGIHPIGEAWTGGANDATELRLSKDVTIGGVAVPAGGYSVWFDVQEGNEWRAMLHEDTTMYHGPHPPIDEEQIIVPVSREKGEDMVETLEWGFEDLGWNDATVTLAWGQERLRMHVEVDAGITLEVPQDEAARYVGEWRSADPTWTTPRDGTSRPCATHRPNARWRSSTTRTPDGSSGPTPSSRLSSPPSLGSMGPTRGSRSWCLGARASSCWGISSGAS